MKFFFKLQIYIKIPKYKQLQKNKCVGIKKSKTVISWQS